MRNTKTWLIKKNKLQDYSSHTVGWRSPSNIALVKYWGKHGDQLPRNPSISFTLSKAFTETIIQYEELDSSRDKVSTQFYFEGKPNVDFQSRIDKFLNRHLEDFAFLKKVQLKIESKNSFPHSSGIASSASAMSALVLCLLSIEQQLTDVQRDEEQFRRRSSSFSRLASGSASRSVFPHLALWGKSPIAKSDDEYAIGLTQFDPVFKDFHDDILIVSAEEKSVSSSAGHALMNGNPYASGRYARANEHIMQAYQYLQNGNVDALGDIIENEALELHALMMCSRPAYVLMEPNTLAIINRIRAYRKETKHPVYFTLDAGPNVHLLYPNAVEKEVHAFVNEQLKLYCHDGRVIRDRVGGGPVEIKQFSL